MLGRVSGNWVEETLIIFGLLAVQCIMGFYVVFVNHALAVGINPLFLIVVTGSTTAVALLPFAVALERKNWNTKLTPVLVAQIVALALGGVTIFQVLMLLGIEKTTPTIASAMPNLSPGLIFTIAACLGFEKFDKQCKYSKAKVLGTLVCLSGAMAMSFLQSPPSTSPQINKQHLSENSNSNGYFDWMLGCFYLLAGVVVLSCNSVLQAATLVNFPAPLSLCTITAMMGSLFTAIVLVVMKGKIDIGSPDVSVMLIGETCLMGGVVIGACIAFQMWCVRKKGPVLVSIFSPVQTVCSTILSAVLYHQMISLGSSAGIVLMFCGLYAVLWAKNNETLDVSIEDGSLVSSAADIEKHLLS
ncbi:WAT1-related protein [Rhynchospora pubera]|uniref:WAT1-related protein n=1 Tax=Rhynchospora pubera TaxID=906938 RepID=A0AAV8EEH1_9POAL|nr:WAT1-related protein [Rhynchospora pubera]